MLFERMRRPKGSIKQGTGHDQREMSLMNKLQQFSREFGTLALTCFGLIANASWPYSFFNMSLSLQNGGPAGMLWMTIGSAAGIYLCDLSLAEMASMTPSSAGPYQWTAELAPQSCQKALSFVVGYFDVIGWQAALAFSAYLVAANIQSMLVLFDTAYVPQNWHVTTLMIASIIFTILLNSRPTNVLRHSSWIMGVLFMCGFLFIGIALAVLAPHPITAEDRNNVAFNFQDNNGWGSNLCVVVGILGPISTFVGGDISCHMSEETEDASRCVPRAIYRSNAIGYILTILTTILIVFSVGPDLGLSLTSNPALQPFQVMFYNATGGDETKTAVMVVFMLLLLMFSQITIMTASSRQVFTFARDQGLPGSGFFAKISRNTHIPWNSVLLTLIISCLLSLIPLGSQIAFNIITSLSSIAIFGSYWVSIACRLANRFSANPVKEPRWNMGKAGIYVNVVALMFLTFGIVMLCFPPKPNPDLASFNWNIVIFVGVIILAIIYYFAYGHRVYTSPRSRLTHFTQAEIVEMSPDSGSQTHVTPDDKAFDA